jgi:DHA1 family bicyclomycin/chloramphenicol resistance-like MFS transporter
MACAPILGSYVTLHFHWQGNFVVMLWIGIACFVLGMLFLPSAKLNRDVRLSLGSYLPVLRCPQFYYYMFAIQASCLAYWVFVGIAPILYMEGFGVSLSAYGWYQGSTSFTFACLSLSSGYLLRRFGTVRCFYLSTGLLAAFVLGVAVLIVLDVQNPLTITLVCHLMAAGIIVPLNTMWPLSLEVLPEAKGRIAALQTLIRLCFMSLGVQIVSYFYHGIFLELGLAMMILLSVGLGFIYVLIVKERMLHTPSLG